jgi:hypothetical protein
MNEEPRKYFFRQRQRNRLYDVVISTLEDDGSRRRDIADRLGVNKSQVSRWLSGPANWEIDTVSDLLFSVGRELDFQPVSFADRSKVISNRFHPASEPDTPRQGRSFSATASTTQPSHVVSGPKEATTTTTSGVREEWGAPCVT